MLCIDTWNFPNTMNLHCYEFAMNCYEFEFAMNLL